jgi:peptidoglycan hydrolase CwlO-like protein
MIIIITSALTVAFAAFAIYLSRQNSNLNETIFEKEGVIEALQNHSRKVENVLDEKKEEIKKLKSEIQSMNDKAKAASKPKTSGTSVAAVTAAPAKAKRKYNKKTA